MQKKLLTSAVLLGLGGFASSASADLASGSLGLNIEGNLNPSCIYNGTYPSCQYGAFDTAEAGSFFNMDGNPGGAVDGDALFLLDGTAQGFNGTAIPPSYVGDGTHVTATWSFFSALGTNVHTGSGVSNNDTEVDMSGWAVVWAEVPFIDMGGDTANAPSDTGIGALVCTGGVDANACEAGVSRGHIEMFEETLHIKL